MSKRSSEISLDELLELYDYKGWLRKLQDLMVLSFRRGAGTFGDQYVSSEANKLISNLDHMHTEISRQAVVARSTKKTRKLHEMLIEFHKQVEEVEGILIVHRLSI